MVDEEPVLVVVVQNGAGELVPGGRVEGDAQGPELQHLVSRQGAAAQRKAESQGAAAAGQGDPQEAIRRQPVGGAPGGGAQLEEGLVGRGHGPMVPGWRPGDGGDPRAGPARGGAPAGCCRLPS